MTAVVADLFVVLDSITDPFSKGLKKAAADAESSTGRITSVLGTIAKVGVGAAVSAAGIGIASIKAASDFQAAMTRLNTQAGVSKDQVAQLSDGVLNLAGQVGFSPDSLAESLYHVESNFQSMGITSTDALGLVKIAAEGAAVGGANLVDVTNALTAAVASGIPGVQDMGQAMGALNKIVGVGDMTMQNLADAFGTGMLATVKGFGVTLADVGAGLATFGDNNIRGAVAGTDFRMAIQALAKPAATAGATLDKLGLTTTTLAEDMQKGGMKLALTDLVDRMNKAGVAADQQGQIITDAFGKKAGTGINILVGQFERTMSKYPDLAAGAGGFAAAWETTKNTFAQQVKDIEQRANALGVRLGLFLIPQITKLFSVGASDFGQIASGFTGQATAPVAHPNLHNALLNQEAAKPPDPTMWQRFGETLHRIVGDAETFGRRLEPVGRNFLTFGVDAYQALLKLGVAVLPTVKVLGGGLLTALSAVGTVLANVVGPAFRWFGDFLDSHKTLFEYFAVGVLGTMALKMAIIGGINAAEGIVNLAAAVVQFPLNQAGQIGDAFTALKTAYTGADAAEGEHAVLGLRGSIDQLKTSTGNALDRLTMLNGTKLSGLAQMAGNVGEVETAVTGVEQAAARAPEQLSLFETSMAGIVQVAEKAPEQLSLFETSLTGVATAEEAVGVNAATAAKSVGALTSETTLAQVGNLATAETAVVSEGAAAAGGIAGIGSKVVALLGPVGIAVGVVTGLGLAISKLYKPTQDSSAQLAAFQDTVNKAAQGSADAAKMFQQEAQQALAAAITPGGPNTGHEQDINSIDAALANLVKSGNAEAARHQVTDLDTSVTKIGLSADDVASRLPQYEKALKDVGDAATTASGQITGMQDALSRQQATAQFQSDLNSLTDSVKTNGATMSDNTAQAIANRQAFYQAAQDIGQFYQQQINAKVPIDQANKSLVDQVTQLEQTASNAGISKGEVDQYIRSLDLIPQGVQTTITMYANTSAAMSNLRGVVSILDQIAGQSFAAATGSGKRGGGIAFDLGGWVNAPVGQPVPAIVHGGEYVVSTDMQAGRAPIDPRALGATALRGGGTGASGGYTPLAGSGVGAAVVNHYYQLIIGGSLVTESQALDKLRSAQVQWSRRNGGGAGWSAR